MDKTLYTYALIKALFEEGKDYIDSFWPLAISVIPPVKSTTLSLIQHHLSITYDIEIPLNVLRSILRRAKRKGYLTQDQDRYKLTDKGLKYIGKLDSQKKVESDVNALLQDLVRFYRDRETEINEEAAYKILQTFLDRNLQCLIDLINPTHNKEPVTLKKPDVKDRLLVDYVMMVKSDNSEHYKVLERLVFGSLISAALYSSEPDDISSTIGKRLKGLDIFLDTNFIFSLLGFHGNEAEKAASELFKLLNNYNLDFYAFSFTIDELSAVLRGYIRDYHLYPTSIGINSIYSNLKRKGLSLTDARILIANIERLLKEKGIEIKWIDDVDLKTYKPEKESSREAMIRYKPNQNDLSRNHDLAAIDKIKGLRKAQKKARRF
jgi:hypothetical protein